MFDSLPTDPTGNDSFASRLAPSALLVFPLVETANLGLNARLPQPAAANGVSTVAFALPEPDRTAVTCCAAQFVGLNINPGRSISTVIRFNRNGTPKMICGNAYGPVSSVVTVNVLSVGFTSIRALTTTKPRLNGPATAGVTIDNPNGAPSCGPVKYTLPSISNGCEPAPDATRVVPISEDSGQLPWSAAGSWHKVTLESIPNNPGGVWTWTPLTNCARSARVKFSVNALNAPARGDTVPATNPGLNDAPPARAALHLEVGGRCRVRCSRHRQPFRRDPRQAPRRQVRGRRRLAADRGVIDRRPADHHPSGSSVR